MVVIHWRSFRGLSTRRWRWGQILLFAGVPAAAGLASFFLAFDLPATTSVGLLTTAGLLSAFLFGLMIQVSDRAATWAAENPKPSEDTSWHALYLEELAASAGYASAVSVVTAVVFVVASSSTKWTLRISSAVGIAIGLHLALTLFAVMGRVFALTMERLRRARTGATRREAA